MFGRYSRELSNSNVKSSSHEISSPGQQTTRNFQFRCHHRLIDCRIGSVDCRFPSEQRASQPVAGSVGCSQPSTN